jgi:hypothetical protein
MAARRNFLNFAKLFLGGDSNNVWLLKVVLVCKNEAGFEKFKSGMILNLI